jgi:hypothetical protein
MPKKKVYYNNKQIEAMTVAAKDEFIIASRGFGKSEGIDAPRLLRNVLHMPGSSGGLLSPTHTKMFINTLPAVKIGLAKLGYNQDVHYVVGVKPNKKLCFTQPRRRVDKYDYVMTWFNGTVVNLLSFDRSMSANSMSLDWIMGFEAKFLSYDKIINEAIPAMRGNLDLFSDCPWHGGMTFSTDMPTMKSGMWILDKEKLMDKELINTILETEFEYRIEKNKNVDTDYHRSKIKRLKSDLNLFRKNATFYAEYDIFDNLELIGEKRIREFKRDLPPLVFQTAILNKRMRKVANGFYSALNEKIHTYEAQSPGYINDIFLGSNTKQSINHDCRCDGDLDPLQPLIIAFDYNAAINNVVTGQIKGRKLLIQNWQFVKTPRKLQELCDDWCDYYDYLSSNKKVIFYYDSTAIASSPDGNARPFYEIVVERLTKRGWNVAAVYIGQQMKHNLKHEYIDQALKGNEQFLLPLFNKHNTEFLFLAMEQTGIKIGRNGFEKDKGIEKTEDSPDNPDELKTHGTDAFDTLFIGCNFYQVDMAISALISTSFGN